MSEETKVSFRCGDCARFGNDCDAGDVDGNEDCIACERFVKRARETVTDCNGLGNVAKMREALEAFQKWYDEVHTYIFHSVKLAVAVDAMKDALAAPPRNCDRPECSTPKGAAQEWAKHCSAFADQDEECAGCLHQHQEHEAPCVVEWMLAPAAREGGK